MKQCVTYRNELNVKKETGIILVVSYDRQGITCNCSLSSQFQMGKFYIIIGMYLFYIRVVFCRMSRRWLDVLVSVYFSRLFCVRRRFQPLISIQVASCMILKPAYPLLTARSRSVATFRWRLLSSFTTARSYCLTWKRKYAVYLAKNQRNNSRSIWRVSTFQNNIHYSYKMDLFISLILRILIYLRY